MSVHAVTARQGGGAYAPRYLRPGAARFPPAAIARTVASKTALRRIALSLVSRTSPLPVAVLIGAWMYYNRKVAPPGFPGWDGLNSDYTVEMGHPPTISPGDYAPNGFSHGPYSPPILRDGLLDMDDGSAIGGFRYWGHFHGLGNPPHLTVPKPFGSDWPTVPAYVPTAPLAPTGTRIRYPGGYGGYRVLPNIIALDDLVIDDGLTDSVVIIIPVGLPTTNTLARTGFAEIGFGVNAKRKRTRSERKMRAKNAFIFHILKRIVNVPFEAKEWIDILAEAADFRGWRKRRAAGFLRPSGSVHGQPKIPKMLLDGRHDNLLKAFYLFQLGGINNLDYEALTWLIIENEVEDFAFGIMGRMSKFTAQATGSPLGPQFGKLM